MNSAFNNQILAEKLRKLNNSQQSIETLSHWCIFHRKKARQVVDTWDKQFRELPKDQRVAFLYLANDILQNSRRRGGEFVSEFWRILPGSLKDVMEKGDDHGRNVVLRLVDIWDERKVFGSRARSLREELLGNDPPPDLPQRPVKSSHSIKIKVPLGGIQEKLTSAYRSVHDVASDEDATLGRCNAAVIRIEGLEKEANRLQNTGELQENTTTLADELQEQQNILSQCTERLEMSELARAALVSHLKEALREQESKLELIRKQLQTAQAQAEHSGNLRQRLLGSSAGMGEIIQHGPQENGPDMLRDSVTSQQQSVSAGEKLPWPPVLVIESMAPVVDESKKFRSAATMAAEVAAKLAASSSSAEVLTSVLSSLAAEEASNMRTATAPLDIPSSSFLSDKRQRLNGQTDSTQSTEGGPTYFQHLPPPPPLQSTSLQRQAGSLQPHVSSSQQLPPPPLFLSQPQYLAANSGNVNMQTLGFAGAFPPPPPLPMHGQLVVGVPRMVMHPQNPNPGPYQTLQPPGMGFYSQPPMPAPHLPRQ